MTIQQVEDHRYWVDSQGNIWERQSYCMEPTAVFVRMSSETHLKHLPQLAGAIGCQLFEDLSPLEHPDLNSRQRAEESKFDRTHTRTDLDFDIEGKNKR